MTFFEHQARARRRTGRLVLLFAVAVVGIVVAVNLVAAVAWRSLIGRGILPYAIDTAGNVSLASASAPNALFVWVTIGTLAAILLRSLVTINGLRAGGDAVARMVGGRAVGRSTRDPDERRLLNVVDEMSIASGVTVPRVYVLPDEAAVNAFAAGYAPNQAAIVVTEGTLRQLNRDELQGVVAHEFSHVLNGDMRLNVQMIGVLAGILFVGELGQFLMRTAGRGDRSSRRDRSSAAIVVAGAAIAIIGFIGVLCARLIKAGVSREREFLADASAVQFTRNAEGVAGALAVIGALQAGSFVRNRHAETVSHMFFAQGLRVRFESLYATHPPLPDRIRRIAPSFVVRDYLRRRVKDLESVESPAPTAPIAAAAPVMAAVAPERPAAARPAAAVIASVGRPTPAHVDHAARLLASLPETVRIAANDATVAPSLVVAFALHPDELPRKQQVAALEKRGRESTAREAEQLAGHVHALGAALRLPVVAVALAALRTLDQPARDALVADVRAVIDADQRVTLEEFALLTVVTRQLRASAARPEPPKYRSILEVGPDAHLVLSLLAHAGHGDTLAAYERGLDKLAMRAPLTPLATIAFPAVTNALDRLARLAPFVKRAYLEACVETVTTDGHIEIAEAELLRAITTSLDCPVPPVLLG